MTNSKISFLCATSRNAELWCCYQHCPNDWWSTFQLFRLCEQTKLSLLDTWKSTGAPSPSSPQRKIGSRVWDHNFWSSWPLLIGRQWRGRHYCDIRGQCGNAMQLLWTRVMSSWDRFLITVVSARRSNNPHSKGINECSAGNDSTKSNFRGSNVPWMARSPHLSACDYIIWGITKAEFSSLSVEP